MSSRLLTTCVAHSFASRLTRTMSSSTAAPSAGYFLLTYKYVDNILEKRVPHRPSHLEHTSKYVKNGDILLGGAAGDPIDSAVCVFKSDRTVIEEYVRNDPYVKNGLVTAWTIKPWTVVVGSLFANE